MSIQTLLNKDLQVPHKEELFKEWAETLNVWAKELEDPIKKERVIKLIAHPKDLKDKKKAEAILKEIQNIFSLSKPK